MLSSPTFLEHPCTWVRHSCHGYACCSWAFGLDFLGHHFIFSDHYIQSSVQFSSDPPVWCPCPRTPCADVLIPKARPSSKASTGVAIGTFTWPTLIESDRTRSKCLPPRWIQLATLLKEKTSKTDRELQKCPPYGTVVLSPTPGPDLTQRSGHINHKTSCCCRLV